MWNLITLAQFQENGVLPGLLQDFMDGYTYILRLPPPLLVELQVSNLGDSLAAGSMRTQFSILAL